MVEDVAGELSRAKMGNGGLCGSGYWVQRKCFKQRYHTVGFLVVVCLRSLQFGGINWNRTRVNINSQVKKLLRCSSCDMIVAWTKVKAMEMKRFRQIQEVLRRKTQQIVYKMLVVEGITGEVRVNDDFKTLLCTFGLSIFLFTKIGCPGERLGFEDLGHRFCVIDVPVSFPNRAGKQLDVLIWVTIEGNSNMRVIDTYPFLF